MKLQNKLMFAVTATIFTSTAMSNTIDFRHEYKEKSEEHASRIKLSTAFSPYKQNKNLRVYTSIEMKIASADKEDFMKNIRLTETELDEVEEKIVRRYKVMFSTNSKQNLERHRKTKKHLKNIDEYCERVIFLMNILLYKPVQYKT